MIDQDISARLDQIEELLRSILSAPAPREFYSVAEIADRLGKSAFTCREWCRLGRVNASKKMTGRGNAFEWKVSHEELLRIQNEGLLPTRF